MGRFSQNLSPAREVGEEYECTEIAVFDPPALDFGSWSEKYGEGENE